MLCVGGSAHAGLTQAGQSAAVHAGAVSAADVSAVQTSWCKFPDVPWGSGVLSWKGRGQTKRADGGQDSHAALKQSLLSK